MPIAIPVLGKATYAPIVPYRVQGPGSGVAVMSRMPEGATQTFKQGVPLMLSGGYLVECDFSGAASVVAGFSAEPGHNLAVAGTAEAGVSEGTAPNQASSRIIPVGAWFRDGRTGLYLANDATIFSAFAVNGATDPPYAQSLVVPGTYYGLTKDATSGFWYVDLADTGGNNAVVELLGVDPATPNTVANGVRVFFMIKAAQRLLA